MGSKFFIIFCLGVLLQDAMGNLERRSYNPRFRNVNKKYLKASSTNGFDEGEKLEEMYLLNTKTKKVTKADVILVSMPMEDSFNELAAEAHHEKHHQHAAFAQHIPQKPNLSSQSESDSTMLLENKPIVLQLLGWTGNPPPPIAFPPMPNKTSGIAPDMKVVPIVIEGDKMEEIIKPVASGAMEADSLIVLSQDNQQEYIQKPEIVAVTPVEDKIMNEEPMILVEAVSQEKLPASASVHLEKPTDKKPIEEIITKTPVMLDIISRPLPAMNEPVPVMIQNEDKINVSDNKLGLIQSAIVADMKLNHFSAGVKNEENASPVIKESSVVSVIIPESMPVKKASSIPQMLEAEHKNVVSESKVEIMSQKIDSEDKKVESSDEKMKITISAQEAETVHKMDEAVEAVLALKKEENASPVVEESSFMSAMIPDTLLVMEDSMPNSVSEMLVVENKKEISEPKIENMNQKLDSEDKKVESSDGKMKIPSIVEEAEKVHKMDKVVEAVPVLLEVAAEPAQESIILSALNSESKLPLVTELLKEDKNEISEIKSETIQNAVIKDTKLNHFGVGMNKKEESALPVVAESSIVSVVIPVENVPVIIEPMQSSIPEISMKGEDKKKVSEPKVEDLSQKIDSEDKKVESSDEKIKKPDSVAKPEKVEKTDNKLMAYASYIFDKISENLSTKKTQANKEPMPEVNSEIKKPSETELMKEAAMAAGSQIPEKQQTLTLTSAMPQEEEKLQASVELSPMKDDKKTIVPQPMIAKVDKVKETQELENASPMVESKPAEIKLQASFQKPVIPELSLKVESVEILPNPSVIVESKVDSKIPSHKPCDKLPELSVAKETEVKKPEALLTAAVKPVPVEPILIKKPIEAEQSMLENKNKEVVSEKLPQAIQMEIMSAENGKETQKPAKRPSRKPRPHKRPSKKPSTTAATETESSSVSSSTSPETTEKTKMVASSIVPHLGY